MKNHLLMLGLSISVCGCAGLDITPITSNEDASLHSGSSDKKGYVIYQPMVVVEITAKETCAVPDPKDKDKCAKAGPIVCTAGKPFTLPDLSKPYLINPKSGLGKAGVEVAITDGWQLGTIKDNSDNTALLGTVEKLLGLNISNVKPGGLMSDECKDPGLYRVFIGGSSEVQLKRLRVATQAGGTITQ